MKRLRSQLARLTPAVAALFALAIAVPRAGLLYHDHPGGEHAHVHPDDGNAIADLLAEYLHDHEHGHDADHEHTHPAHHDAHVGHRDPRSSGSPSAALESDSGSATAHCHEQDRFHRAVVPRAPFIPAVTSADASLCPAPALSIHVAARTLRARGPPSVPIPQHF
jgi:hypothetical protein